MHQSSRICRKLNGTKFCLIWTKILPRFVFCVSIQRSTRPVCLYARQKRFNVRKHWHTANETHTIINGVATFACGGKKFELSEGGFNFMPAKMVQLGGSPTDGGGSHQVITPLKNARHSRA